MKNEAGSRKPTLGVNIDHVATIRQARGTPYPSLIDAAFMAVDGGADQITIHLREDRRHIQNRDPYELKKVLSVPLNLEMSAAEEIVKIALDLKPGVATLVPEKREELTTEGGLDCIANKNRLFDVVRHLRDGGIKVSLFIDPEKAQIEMSKELGADAIELHTGTYCELVDTSACERELNKLKEAAKLSQKLGLKVCAGHGLNYHNTAPAVRAIPEIVEYNIGHAIIARAVFVGLTNAVKEMKELL